MDLPDMPGDDQDSQTGRLAASARGWHRIQLAALGFIGLCGVLWSAGESSAPESVGWIAGLLALTAIVLQGVAIYLVGTVAYPFYGVAASARADTDAAKPAAKSRRMRTGIRMTYGAVGLVAVATLAAWWPHTADSDLVEVRDAAGASACGELVDGSGGQLALDTADGPVTVSLEAVAELRLVSEC